MFVLSDFIFLFEALAFLLQSAILEGKESNNEKTDNCKLTLFYADICRLQ